jgi:uncharacterized MnhB-related membrane protein
VIGLQLVTFVLTGAGALAIVVTHDVLRQAILFAIYGLLLVVLFVVLQAPDVALSALVVSSVASPVVVVVTLAKVQRRGVRKR